ncbi:MAG: ATP-binding cassette domain-containing protein [Tissierellia bacterium]|nr:ATP-binding cassette domain-containing protein [Tissierellia bacterium]
MRLDIVNINKSFSEKQILHDVSFSVQSGKAMGFLGRNGAGKTTTIRALMGVFKQDSGQFLLDGKPFDPNKNRVGYLPEERGMYAKEPILEQLIYFGKLRGASRAEALKSAEYWIERFELSEHKKKKLETLSKGNQQKIQISQAFLTNPDILILDEPFSGLDPVNSQTLKDIILEFISDKKLVIFSSHQMAYVEDFCDEITLINKGKVVLSGDLKDIKREMRSNKIRISAQNFTNEEFINYLRENIKDINIGSDRHSAVVELLEGKSSNELLGELISKQVEIEMFSMYEPSLQDIFIREVGDER